MKTIIGMMAAVVLLPGPGLVLAAAGMAVPPAAGGGAVSAVTGGSAMGTPADPSLSAVPATAVAYALGQLGTPYVWGGEAPGVGFDCSGLVQAAFGAAGVHLPRVAQAQFDAGPGVPAGAPLIRGDLVFFGSGPGAVSHVGIYLSGSGPAASMVDAPHSGAVVRIEAFSAVVGARWGTDLYVGATRPR